MTTTSEVRAAMAAVRALVAGVESLPRGELLALQREVFAVKREWEVVTARLAAEVTRRSEPEPGAVGLSRREGFQSPQALVASVSGGTTGEAGRLARVGKVMADAARAQDAEQSTHTTAVPAEPHSRQSPDGIAPPTPTSVFAVLASALTSGDLSVEVGDVIASALSRVADTLAADELAQWEQQVVDKTVGLPLIQARRMVAFAEARVNPRELAVREERAFQERFATMRPQADGSMLLTARLDPVSAAPVRAMIDGYVRDAFQQRDTAKHAANATDGASSTGLAGGSAGTAPAPAPTAGQLRADALAWLARHAAGCDATHAGVKTTVVVRMSLEDLQSGEGIAEIDGAQMPVSVSAARQLAADAQVIPTVLGSDSEILDWGRKKRLFTHAQRLALVERDGGCAKCHAPPDWCEAHHIEWWGRDKGPTDLNNGIMLCVRCHHDIHRDGWTITVRDNQVWFLPPQSIDRARTPALGGRARLELAA